MTRPQTPRRPRELPVRPRFSRPFSWLRRGISLRARVGEDRGSISLYFAIVTIATLVMAGLVLDGGAALAAREKAADLATQAARSGADALTPASLRGEPGDLQADPVAARQAVTNLLAAADARGTVTVSGHTVSVTVTVPKHTVILSAVGVDDISQTASASATAVYGGTTQDGGG